MRILWIYKCMYIPAVENLSLSLDKEDYSVYIVYSVVVYTLVLNKTVYTNNIHVPTQ